MKKLFIAIAAVALMGQGCLAPDRVTTQPPIAQPNPAPAPRPTPTPTPKPTPTPIPYNY